MHDFVHDATHEFLHLDGKILSTVKLLVLKPGELSKAFVEGRRARHISPLRVYLTFSLIFFFLATVAPPGDRIMKVGTGPSAAAPHNAQEEREANAIGDAVAQNLPRLMFVLMPAFGLLTLAFYRRRQPFYVPHLYFSVHLHAFVFLLLSVVALLGLTGRLGKDIGSMLFFAIVPYHYLALRRFFGQPWWTTFWKGTLAGLVYVLLIAAALGGIAFYTIRYGGIAPAKSQRSGSSNARPTIDGSTDRSRYSHTASASG